MSSTTYFERLVDRDNLQEYLSEEFGSVTDFEITHHQAGHSNETLLVKWGDRDLVIRRPPPGEKAEKAHDVLREYKVMNALQETDVPVPPTLISCDDKDVIGSDFFVMEKVNGDVIRRQEPDRFSNAEQRKRIGDELTQKLAQIHNINYESIGLGEFGHPEGFTDRQVKRWSQQIIWAFSHTEEHRPCPELYEIGEWLKENKPDDHPHVLVHGDYKVDNVMFAESTPARINAIFDWELSTLGDPFTDLGWMLTFWRDAEDPPPAVGELAYTYMEHPDYQSRLELVNKYKDLTGYEYQNDKFYRTLAVYKLAALGEMFYARYILGDSDDPLYPKMEDGVPELAERAFNIIEGKEPL